MEPSDAIELQLGQGIGLRTEFIWRHDRHAHVVTLIEPAGERTLFESIEGEPDQAWPPSPAFQQLSMQGRGPQRVALLVGMAGKSHWSMSVEASASRRGIVFDVACRLNEPATGMLGSCYRATGYAQVDPSTVATVAGTRRATMMLDPSPASTLQSICPTADQLRIRCHAESLTTPSTARWKYAVTVA